MVGRDTLKSLLQLRDPPLQSGDPAVLLPVLVPPAVPDLLLELHRALEDFPVLCLHPGALFSYAPLLHTAPVYRKPFGQSEGAGGRRQPPAPRRRAA